jgi:hypothetical protein
MNTPTPPKDELLKSLVEEANGLPQTAAAHARSRQRTRMNTVRVAGILSLSLLALGIWFSHRAPRGEPTNEAARTAKPSEVPDTSKGYVKAYPAGEAEPGPTPPDTSERERRLLTELSDVPVLIVKNGGEISRVHIFER